MSGWDEDSVTKNLEITFDLEQATEWMDDLEGLDGAEKAAAFKKILQIMLEAREDDEYDDRYQAEKREYEADQENNEAHEIRPSEVRMTELEPETGKVHFYSGPKVVTNKWLGSRNLEDWPEIFEHMKKRMHPSIDDDNAPKIRWAPKEI